MNNIIFNYPRKCLFVHCNTAYSTLQLLSHIPSQNNHDDDNNNSSSNASSNSVKRVVSLLCQNRCDHLIENHISIIDGQEVYVNLRKGDDVFVDDWIQDFVHSEICSSKSL
jgi:hypothetical protein